MSRKAESRLAKKAEKEAKRKQAALLVVPNSTKAAAFASPPDVSKVPAVATTPEQAAREMQPVWLFDKICSCFPDEWPSGAWDAHIAPKLKSFGCLTWKELDGHKDHKSRKAHHDMPVSSLIDAAQTQLKNSAHGQITTIFRFALDRKKRLWGFREIPRFSLLWYDPTHKIYVTRKHKRR